MESLPYGFEKAVFWKQPGLGKDWANLTGKWTYIYSVSEECSRTPTILLGYRASAEPLRLT